MRRQSKVLLSLWVLLVAATIAPAEARGWTRLPYEDAEVVARSPLIVIGHIKRGSIVYVPHQAKPPAGASWEHHAVLEVSSVVKGSLQTRQLPIILHYGLTPVVGGYVKRPSFMLDLRGQNKSYPQHIIEIMDTGASAVSFRPLVPDAGQDHIWLLRQRSGQYGRQPGTGKYGIVDPEDLQPLSLLDYFLAYLAPDPVIAVKLAIGKHPKMGERGGRFLAHQRLQRILRTADLKKRAWQLLPLFKRRHTWNGRLAARPALVDCGKAAGGLLLKAFDDPAYRSLRGDIMFVWRQTRYGGCVPRLARLLSDHDRFWATQKLAGDWWNAGAGTPLNQQRRQIYGEVYDAVVALEHIGDRRARGALQRTLKRWQAIGFSNPQIVEACERGLSKI